MLDDYALSLGVRLRAIRQQQGLSLHAVEEKSEGRWKAVVVGSYERGDRAITVAKLAELAAFYGIPVGQLLPDAEARPRETKPMRSPGRREIGHGALAERALVPVLPSKESFPYVLRVVSECLSSNGSTSMGSVCGSTLALMDAGVPLKAPVSGAAMGLIKEGSEVRILTDIQGIEDFLGDMDFKVAGTEKGITALQMDMKITGLEVKTVAEAINQARPARLHILEKMLEAIDKPRDTMSPHAPRLLSFRIDPELIGTVIGPGGRTIKGITERTNTKIDIEDGGIVTIASHDGAAAEEAQRIIEGLTRRVSEGEVFSGAVTRVIPIGAFVEILPGKEGMIHISQLSEARVEKVEDVVRVGDQVTVRVREIDNRGRINLTLRGVPQAEDPAAVAPESV